MQGRERRNLGKLQKKKREENRLKIAGVGVFKSRVAESSQAYINK